MRPPIELMKTMRPRARRIGGSIAWVTATWRGQVDLDLAAEVLERQRLQRARDGDAGVVDEAVEAARGLGRDPRRRGGDLARRR